MLAGTGPLPDGPEDATTAKIIEYASKVRTTGQWLDVTDAAIFTDVHESDLVVGTDPFQGDELAFQPVSEYFTQHIPSLIFTGIDSINRASPHTWCLLSTNAKFQQDGLRNHWVVGYFREQLNEASFKELTVETCKREEKQAAGLVDELSQLKVELDRMNGSGSLETVKAILASQISKKEEDLQEFLAFP